MSGTAWKSEPTARGRRGAGTHAHQFQEISAIKLGHVRVLISLSHSAISIGHTALDQKVHPISVMASHAVDIGLIVVFSMAVDTPAHLQLLHGHAVLPE